MPGAPETVAPFYFWRGARSRVFHMQVFLKRRQHLLLLVAALAAQILLLAVQIKRGGDVRLIRLWAVALVTPVEKVANATLDSAASLWHGYIDLRAARQETRALRQELEQSKLRIQQLESRAAETARLEALLKFQNQYSELPTLPARVIASSPALTSRVLFIDRGREQGVERDMAVITPEGIVGKVVQVFPSSAQVLLLTDERSGVGALLERSRVHGVVKGIGGATLRLDYVMNDDKVEIGERVLTSGEDQVYPKGLFVGTVAALRPGSVFQEIAVRPAVSLNRLEEVLVVLQRGGALDLTKPPEETPEPAARKP